MKCQQRYKASLLCVAGVVMLLCTSVVDKAQPSNGGAVVDGNYKYHIDISSATSTGPYTLSKKNDERVVWTNNSNVRLYVCTDPSNSPFNAHGWRVPAAGGERKSGKIRDAINPPSSGLSFDFYSSQSSCVWPPPPDKESNRSNPKIIIQQ
jgi:hypothetical protein